MADECKTMTMGDDLIRWQWIASMGAAAALLLLAACNVGDIPIRLEVQMLLLGIGLGGLVFAARPVLRQPGRQTLLVLVGILLLAFALRWVALGDVINRYVDELHGARAVVQYREDPTIPLLLPFDGVPEFTRTFPALQVGATSMLESSVIGLRLPSVAFGMLTVAAVFALGAALWNRRLGLLAALLLAAFPPAIHFSRIGLNNIADPFFGMLALAALARTRHQPNVAWFVLAGVSLALTTYFYEGGRLLFPPLIAIYGLLIGLRSRCRAVWQGLGITLIVGVLVAAPVFLMLAAEGAPATPRLADTTPPDLLGAGLLGLVAHVIDQLNDAVAILVQSPDQGWFYGGPRALILPWLVPFFLLGLLRTMWRAIREPDSALLLMWLGATVVGSALLVDVNAPRYVVAFPVLALLMAAGVDLAAHWLARVLRWRHVTVRRSAAALALIAVVGQAGYYFGVHAPYTTDQFSEQVILDDVFRRAAALPDNTHAQVFMESRVGNVDGVNYMRFRERHEDVVFMHFVEPENASTPRMQAIVRVRNAAFFVHPESQDVRQMIERTFPEAKPQPSPMDSLQDETYLMYFVPQSR